jgi:ABC-type sugar transport system substrate-binding protein
VSTPLRRPGRAVSGLAALGAVTLLLASCSTSSGTSSASTGATGASKALPKTLVFSPLALSPPALKGLSVGVTGYAKSKGWTVITQDPNFDASKQEQDLATVIDSGRVGAAWVLANDPKSMGPTIKEAQAKGVPILVNGQPSEYGYTGAQPGVTFDYIDYTAAGKALGDQLGQCIVKNAGGTGQVLFNQSAAGQAGKAQFDAAAVAALKAAAPNATIVQNLIVTDRAKGQVDVGNALQGHPKLVGVMSSTDEGTLGAQGAFKAAGKKLACNVDFGGDAEVLKDVAAGTIFASVALQFNADLAQSFDTLQSMSTNPKAVGQILTVPQKIITANG